MSNFGQGFPMGFGTPIQSQGSDWSATGKQFPGFSAVPVTTETNGLYTAWREINGAQWTLQNADIGANGFYIVNPAFPAWAFVQQFNGGFAQYTAPGNSQPGFTWTPIFVVNNLGQVTTGGGFSFAINFGTNFSATPVGKRYNYGSYVAAQGSANGPGTDVQNSAAMQAALSAMYGTNQVPCGGLLEIPGYQFQIDSTATGFAVPAQMIMQGLGTGGSSVSSGGVSVNPNYHFQILGSGASNAVPNILFSMTGKHSSGGTRFQELGFDWSASSNATDTCIFAAGWNTTAELCEFHNCPTAFNGNGLSSGLQRCTIEYRAGSPANAIAVILQQNQAYAIGPGEFLQDGVSGGGPAGCAAIGIGGGQANANGIKVQSLHLAAWSYGITFNTLSPWGGLSTFAINGTPRGGCQDVQIGPNMVIDAGITGIYVQPNDNSHSIYGIKIHDSIVRKGQNATDGHALIYIDSNGGTYTNVYDVSLIDVSAYNNMSSGVQPNTYAVNIGNCANVKIIGGSYNNMGGSASGAAGIAFSGNNVGNTIISSVDLRQNSPNGNTNLNQQYGVLFLGTFATAFEGVTIRDCFFGTYTGGGHCVALLTGAQITSQVSVDNCNFGTTTNPVQVQAGVLITAPFFKVTNCAGYNDQGTVVNSAAPVLGGSGLKNAANGSTYGSGGVNYYGPQLVWGVNTGSATTFTLGLQTTTILANQMYSFYIPGPWVQIQFSQAPSTFFWIGY